MADVAIELVDAGLLALRGDTLSGPSPGVALLEPAGVTIGDAAARQLRLRPAPAVDRFWTELSSEPMLRPALRARSHADLAFLHLSQFWGEVASAGDEAFFAVPGSNRPEALGLLAGIARTAGISTAGWVDAAVAACAALPARETVLHLDVQLHQSVLTVLDGRDQLRRRRVEVAPRAGLKPLFAAWGQLIAEAMVRRTRFDPLHQAATEQQLFDRLPQWLRAAATTDAAEIQVEAAAGQFAITLPREQFAFAAEAWYSQLIDLVHAARRAGMPVTIALTARAGLLPGLAERCAALGDVELLELEAGAAARGALAAAATLRTATPAMLVAALPRGAQPTIVTARARADDGLLPTHVLLDGRAHPITAEPLLIGLAADAPRALALRGPAAGVSRRHCLLQREGDAVIVRDLSRYGTFVNGERVIDSAQLLAGDRLRLGQPGIALELVAVG